MSTTWLYADPHFSHEGVCNFLRDDGSKLRPWTHAADMDAELIMRYQAHVRPKDKVYFLGDAVMKPKFLPILEQLPGDKVLIKGNHDIGTLSQYSKYFRDIRACWQLAGCLLTHIPIHPDCLGRWTANIHGHLHYREVMEHPFIDPRIATPDSRYLCVSVEHTHYTPILLEAAIDRIKRRQSLS